VAGKRGLNKLFNNWSPVIAWGFLIFYLSGIPGFSTSLGVYDIVLRKLAHVTEYCILFLLTRRAFGNSFGGWKNNKVFIVSALFSVLYAASDEFHQSFVPTRCASITDVGIDSAGVAAGFFLNAYLERSKVQNNEI
jgi:VanZ family protein